VAAPVWEGLALPEMAALLVLLAEAAGVPVSSALLLTALLGEGDRVAEAVPLPTPLAVPRGSVPLGQAELLAEGAGDTESEAEGVGLAGALAVPAPCPGVGVAPSAGDAVASSAREGVAAEEADGEAEGRAELVGLRLAEVLLLTLREALAEALAEGEWGAETVPSRLGVGECTGLPVGWTGVAVPAAAVPLSVPVTEGHCEALADAAEEAEPREDTETEAVELLLALWLKEEEAVGEGLLVEPLRECVGAGEDVRVAVAQPVPLLEALAEMDALPVCEGSAEAVPFTGPE
jgi:hypothetical protein